MRTVLTSSLLALALQGAIVLAQEPAAAPPAPETVVRAAGPIAWGKSLEAARRSAQPSQVIVVDVTADWCTWCRYMDTKVFPDQAVREFATNHLFVRFDPKDGAEGQAFAKKLKVKAFPAFFVFGPDGKLLRKQIGAFDGPTDFIAWVRGAVPAR
jgi:thiol:disulfide interchange protein